MPRQPEGLISVLVPGERNVPGWFKEDRASKESLKFGVVEVTCGIVHL